MLFSSPVYSQTSGSIAGITYSHGRGGMITKARSTPTNPNTARQRTIRHAIATLGSYWGQTLTETERAAWRLYASNVAWKNRLGQTTYLTGSQHFTRCNVPRIQASIDILEAAPKIYDLGTFTPPIITAISSGIQAFIITFDNTDDWANVVDGHMLCYGGRPTGPGTNFYGGPHRFNGELAGNPVPPVTPVAFTTPWHVTSGQICWCQIRIIQGDGRLSSPIVLGPKTVI